VVQHLLALQRLQRSSTQTNALTPRTFCTGAAWAPLKDELVPKLVEEDESTDL